MSNVETHIEPVIFIMSCTSDSIYFKIDNKFATIAIVDNMDEVVENPDLPYAKDYVNALRHVIAEKYSQMYALMGSQFTSDGELLGLLNVVVKDGMCIVDVTKELEECLEYRQLTHFSDAENLMNSIYMMYDAMSSNERLDFINVLTNRHFLNKVLEK